MPLPSPVGASPIESIRFAGKIEVPAGRTYTEGSSLPDHLIHFHISGEAHRECGGRQYVMGPQSAIWYYDDEFLRLKILKPPVVFYSMHFSAPTLPPPNFEARMFPNLSHDVNDAFETLVQAWYSKISGAVRDFQVHSAALKILSFLSRPAQPAQEIDTGAKLWWEIENRLRNDLSQKVNVTTLSKLAGRDPTAVANACKHAVGIPPMKRVKQIRMSYARGLVQRSTLSLKQIAAEIGYPRIHEFSRDYRKQFGVAPSFDRERFRQQ